MSMEEATVIARAKAGDDAAFAALYGRYERRIYGFARRMLGNPDDAFDLTQETFLKAYRALPGTNAELNVNAWLHRIAANAGIGVLRRRRYLRWLPLDGLARDCATERGEDDPEGMLLGGEARRAVQRALAALPPRHRQALILREYEGLTYADIGAIMGLSLPAVKSTLFRAREGFRDAYRTLEGRPRSAPGRERIAPPGAAAAGRRAGDATGP